MPTQLSNCGSERRLGRFVARRLGAAGVVGVVGLFLAQPAGAGDESAPGPSSSPSVSGPSSPGPAELVSTIALADPITGQRFETQVLLVSNGRGGFDSDGCPYSQGPQPRSFAVATSPYTLYSAPVESFEEPVAEALHEPLRQRLLALGAPSEAGSMLPSRRFELAAIVAEVRGEGPYAVGDHLLSAAWSVRDRVVGFLPAVQGAGDAWKKLQSVLSDYRALDNSRARTIASFDLARLGHRGGFVEARDALLARIDTYPDAGLGAREKRESFRALVAREQELLLSARARFDEGLADGLGSPADRAYRRYLVGELSRRVGDPGRARTDLRAVASDPNSAAEVRGLVTDILSAMDQQAAAGGRLDLTWTTELVGASK